MPTDADVEFGQIAVRHKLITRKQHDEAFKVLKKLELQLKRKGKLKKTRPRLVDILVQQDMLSGSEAKSVENARKFRQIRLGDKLYARIALKSKFCDQSDIQAALDKQKKRYQGGKSLKRLSDFLISTGSISSEEDEAIQDAITKLDAVEYVARDGRRSSEGSDVEESDDDSDVEELDSDLEEIDDDEIEELDDDEISDIGSGIDLDLDDDEEVESLDNDSDLDEIDSDIDVRLSGMDDDIDDLSDMDAVSDVDHRNDTKTPAPRGLSSDDDAIDLDDDDDDDDDVIDLDDDDEPIDLDSDDGSVEDDDDDDDDDDGSDDDLDADSDADSEDEGGSDDSFSDMDIDLDDIDDDDD